MQARGTREFRADRWHVRLLIEQLVNMMTDADFKLAEREKRADG